MTVKRPSVGKVFEAAGAGQSHQILQLKDQVEALEAEVLRLRTNPEGNAELEQQIQELTSQLSEREGLHEIAIELIDPDPDQPRQTITDAMKQARAESLRQYGQLTPIIVIPQANGRYKLFEGELRWRSAPLVPMKTLQSVFLRQSQDAATIFRGQLLTRLHDEDLHDLDLAEALIQDIRNHVPGLVDADDIPQRLEAGIRHLRKLGRLPELSTLRQQSQKQQEEWIDTIEFDSVTAALFTVLLDLHLNPASVASNIFPLLRLQDDLKQAIRATGLDSSKARAIAQIRDNDQREAILDAAIDSSLPLSEIKKQVAKLQERVQPEVSLKQQFAGTVKRLQKSSIWKDPTREKKLQDLMEQIEELLKQDKP
jgi:ParB family transcriptional regulator, chromosome partitioning protein